MRRVTLNGLEMGLDADTGEVLGVAVLWVPAIRITGDLAKMVGYPVGWVWRLRHRNEIPR